MICPPLYTEQRQRGSVAIEFAAIFLLFFTLVYGAIAYGIPAMIQLSFQHLTAEASRAALKVDPDQSSSSFVSLVSQEVSATITASWLPEAWRTSCSAPDDGGTWEALPSVEGGTSYGYIQTESLYDYTRYQLYVCIQTQDSIVPQLILGDIRLPDLPKDSSGTPVIRASTLSYL